MYKKIIHSFILFILFSCNQNKESIIDKKNEQSINEAKIDTLNEFNNKEINDSIWIEDFKKFREALYHDNLDSILNFIEFPLAETTWFGVYGDNFLKNNNYKMEKDDFIKNYKKIFPNSFVKSLLSIKSDLLFYEESVMSSKPTLINKDLYKAFICHTLKTNYFIIGISHESLDIESYIYEKNNSCKDFSTQYYFEIDSNNHIKFKGINLTG